jgi:indoleamine 2,3-dioxygenase
LDVFLNVTHSPLEDPASTSNGQEDSKQKKTAETTFMTRMLEYMPAPHRAFLTHLASHPHPVRQLVLDNQLARPQLVQAYDSALGALKRLREKHMRVATLYIIQQARKPVTEELIRMGAAAPTPETALAAASSSTGSKKLDLSEFIHEAEAKKEADEEIRGTGGTALIKFLKMCRDNTNKTRIGRD